MSKPVLHIITAVSRPDNLAALAESIAGASDYFHVCWHLESDAAPHVGGQRLKNQALDRIGDGWVWMLDDDNAAHPCFFARLRALLDTHDTAWAFAFSQRLPDGAIRRAGPDTMRLDAVDIAQVVFRRDAIGARRLDESYGGDGLLIEALHTAAPAGWIFCEEPLCYYNRLRSS